MNGTISRPSVASLFVVPLAQSNSLSTATGFVVQRGGSSYLVTNWHVVAGRNPVTGTNLHPSGAWPEQLVIFHNVAGQLGAWQGCTEDLRDEDGPLWYEHPTEGRRVDVVALRLPDTTHVELYPHELEGGPDILAGTAQQVSIVGFPFGRTGGGAFAI